MPKRIQRKRTAGWRMPKGAVYVGRPTKWGNPFVPNQDNPVPHLEMIYVTRQYQCWLHEPEQANLITAIRSELRGKDLACWCPNHHWCHADVLLEIANSEGEA
jgi:hypothetical protein